MRRISPVSLRKYQSCHVVRSTATKRSIALPPCPTHVRPLFTSSAAWFPRGGPYGRTTSSSESAMDHEASGPGPEEDAPDVDLATVMSSPDGQDPPPAPHRSFSDLVSSLVTPAHDKSPLPKHLSSLQHHMLAAFHPASQPLLSTSSSSSQPFQSSVVEEEADLNQLESSEAEEAYRSKEQVLALVTPFEGGGHYIEDAVNRVAASIDADLLRFDLSLGLGLGNPPAPLDSTFGSPPSLPVASNPLFQNSARPKPLSQSSPASVEAAEDDMADDLDEEMDGRPTGPIVLTTMPGRLPINFEQINSLHLGNRRHEIRENWMKYFEKVINQTSSQDVSSTSKRRIILLESVPAMASTFEEWWPSLVEAVRLRRCGQKCGKSSTRKKDNVRANKTLLNPTIIMLSAPPSLLLPHTAAPIPSTIHSKGEDFNHPIHPMLQEIASRYGGSVETKFEGTDDALLWWGSEEADCSGRQRRNEGRLSAIMDEGKGPSALIPSFSSQGSSARRGSGHRHPLFEALASQLGRQSTIDDTKSDSSISMNCHTIPILPLQRDQSKEMMERLTFRSIANAALLGEALHRMGARLVDPIEAASRVEVERKSSHRGKRGRKIQPSSNQQTQLTSLRLTRPENAAQLFHLLENSPYQIAQEGWQNTLRPWTDLQRLATFVLGRALADSMKAANNEKTDTIQLTWEEVVHSVSAERQNKQSLNKLLNQFLPLKSNDSGSLNADGKKNKAHALANDTAADPVIAKVKHTKDLNSYERRLLSCIVDTAKLSSTTFDDVHLPFRTIDAIRTIISLPLLFPEAFRGGVLRDHSTTGALLFGPPGTGKTLLARAVANESGARMLAVQPSDVNDKYYGEGEKLVKAVFSLARRLSPCVVFLDEVDVLFGARSSGGAGFGNKAHDQLLTEFMQEMDGLSSAEINKNKRVVVVGATNRPFDLDDAILRRLPRRLLVDLPGLEDRKAILGILLRGESLDEKVDIDQIARETEGYSGSDLKHLCVSAALSAVKDAFHVPWERSSFGKETEQPTISAAPSNGGRAEQENVILPIEPSEASRLAEPIPQHSSASIASDPGPHILCDLAPGKESDTSDLPLHSTETSNMPVLSPTAADTESLGESNANHTDSPSPSLTDPTHSLSSTPKPGSSPRVLLRKHFDIALGEIRPSSTEEGSLPELRKWAEQFGEGGSQKGQKKGFGKGFGFSDPETASLNRNKGYGKVAQDD